MQKPRNFIEWSDCTLRNKGGTVIGAIGVSGSAVENDHAVAEAGAAVVK